MSKGSLKAEEYSRIEVLRKVIMKTHIAAVILIIVVLAAGACTSGRRERIPRNTLVTAEETVKAFCDLDGEGVRLTSATWSRILPYIAWTEEAGWDRIAVIEGYRLVNTENRSERLARITVEYEVAGNLSQDYMAVKKKEIVIFTVQKTGEGWKIKDPDFMLPHVLIQPLVRHLRETKRLEVAEKIHSIGTR